MKITTDDKGFIVVKEVYNPITLETNSNESMVLCMRDSGFEFTYNNVMYEAKNGEIRMVKDSDTIDKPTELHFECRESQVLAELKSRGIEYMAVSKIESSGYNKAKVYYNKKDA